MTAIQEITNQTLKPSLYTVTTFGRFSIRVGERDVLNIMDLGPNLRKIFAVLVSSPEKRINAEQVQTLFWPESSARQGRLKLDTTVTRLKGEISRAVGLPDKSDHISIRKGQLRLRDISLDSDLFQKHAHEGIEYAGEGLDLLASDSFQEAFGIWQGEYLPGAIREEYPTHSIYEKLLELYRRSSELWCDILLTGDIASPECFGIFKDFIAKDPGNTGFIRKIYHLYIRSEKPEAAADLVERYESVLLKEGLNRKDIEKTMALLWEQRRIANRLCQTDKERILS